MRGKILEREIVGAEEVFSLAEIIERSSKETLQYETSKIQLGVGEMMASQNVNQGGLEEANEVNAMKNRRRIQKGKRPWIRYLSVQFQHRVLQRAMYVHLVRPGHPNQAVL